MRPMPSRRQEPVTAMRAYEGISMTSMNTNRLNRSAVMRAPLTPVCNNSTSAGTNRRRSSSVSVSMRDATAVTADMMSIISAVTESATRLMANTAG